VGGGNNSIIMSAEEDVAEDMMCYCASCGKAEVDDVKLKMCTACKLVKYCSVDCQKNHRQQHKKACKKRAAEIRDDKLFTQPDGSYLGECPICCLPLPLDDKKSGLYSCCSQRICKGCEYANKMREDEAGLTEKCPYCREQLPTTPEEANQNTMERVKANDPNALCEIGKKFYKEGDYEKAFEYFTKAATLGNMMAHYNLAVMYYMGEGVEKDEKKRLHHLEEAAIGGHPVARYNLAGEEQGNGRRERALKHLIIAAKLGYDEALDAVKGNFRRGLVSKEYYEAALRGHQAAVDATKSEERDKADQILSNTSFMTT
jgi:TPR repeat protein